MYAHPKERRVECPDYNRGFCKLGECDASLQSTKYEAKSCNQDPNVRENMYVVWYAKTTSPASVLLVQNVPVASKLSHPYAFASPHCMSALNRTSHHQRPTTRQNHPCNATWGLRRLAMADMRTLTVAMAELDHRELVARLGLLDLVETWTR